MRGNRWGTTAAVTAAAVVASSLGLGVALGSGSGSVNACVNQKQALSLLSRKGKCARGTSPVTIADRGPVGPRGATGPAGRTGPAGPGAASSAVDITQGTVDHVITVGPDTITSYCSEHEFPASRVSLSHGSSDQFIHGTIYTTFAGGGPFTFPGSVGVTQRPSGVDKQYSQGSNEVGVQSTAGTITDFSGYPGVGTDTSFQLHVIVSEGLRVYTVDVAAFVTFGTRCQMFTQVTPSNGDTAVATS